MSLIARFSVLLLCSVFILGCGGEDNAPAEGVDHDADYALEIKARTLNFVETWRNDKQEAQWLLDGLTEQLAAHENFPTDAHNETYAMLYEKVQAMQDNYSSVSSATVDELAAAAEELPGDPSTFVMYD